MHTQHVYYSVFTADLGISDNSVQKIVIEELKFYHTKPWYTDVITPAQKLKRMLFCMRLLRMTDKTLYHWLCKFVHYALVCLAFQFMYIVFMYHAFLLFVCVHPCVCLQKGLD